MFRKYKIVCKKHRIFLSLTCFLLLGQFACLKPPVYAKSPKSSHPGVNISSKSILRKINARRAEKKEQETPRTKHLNADGSAVFTNRLYLETSPYLLQHAHNPVNWFPWGDEAFAMAKKQNKPVFLSVGYSTCHWCHVMEEESFEDLEVAKYLNENYIAIKVDREERPDVDAIYMEAVRLLTGSGGWPMSVWLNSDKEVFMGGTYFPARDGDRGTRKGFLSILKELKNEYTVNAAEISKKAKQISARVRTGLGQLQMLPELPNEEIFDRAFSTYLSNYDSEYGGMKRRHKFPSSLSIRFLLRYALRHPESKALAMAEQTLQNMAKGGLYDQIGGGFHRYSTDVKWLAPHFEKMLYDNALLVPAYLEAFQMTKNPFYKRIATEVLDYVSKEMTSPEGGFYSATDADSFTPSGKREEGYFFLWSKSEIESVLDKEPAKLVVMHYGVTNSGNFEGLNILHVVKPLKELQSEFNKKLPELEQILKAAKKKLYQFRLQKPAPLLDDKILLSWNALMISAFSKAALVLDRSDYLRAAKKATDFIWEKMQKNGRLLRSFHDGDAQLNAYFEDYSFFNAALLDIFESSSNIKYFKYAKIMDQSITAHFEDTKKGGFFTTSDDHEELLVKKRSQTDGAVPSGASIEAMNLYRLAILTSDDAYRKRADKAVKTLGGYLRRAPTSVSELLLALNFNFAKVKEIVLTCRAAKLRDSIYEKFIRATQLDFHPYQVLIKETNGLKELEIPLLKNKTPKKDGGICTAYVCHKGVCEIPTTDLEQFKKLLMAK